MSTSFDLKIAFNEYTTMYEIHAKECKHLSLENLDVRPDFYAGSDASLIAKTFEAENDGCLAKISACAEPAKVHEVEVVDATIGLESLQGQEGKVVNLDGRPKEIMVPADVQALAMGRRQHEKAIADEKKSMRVIELAACQARRNGAPIKQIAELAGLTRNTVYKMLERNGLYEAPGSAVS